MKKPELLVPAGSLEVLKTAVMFGADAVYIGGESFSLRANAKNFSLDEMKEGVSFAHDRGVKVYVTANIIAHNSDLRPAEEYFKALKSVGPDAVIVSDPAVFMLAKDILPGTDIHISTQANNTNCGTFRFWHSLGAKRVVAARELSLKEIRQIRDNVPEDLEIEAFVHGAMCVSYSGRCLLSGFLVGRDSNRGDCTHPCRWNYAVAEETRPGEYMPVYENERGTFIFNSKDLCMIAHIPELVKAGIDSFKIEGRMRAALYVATAARTYRMAIDDYFESEERYRDRIPEYEKRIAQCTYRQYTTGFYFGKPDQTAQIYDHASYETNCIYLGIAGDIKPENCDAEAEHASLIHRNKLSSSDAADIIPDERDFRTRDSGTDGDSLPRGNKFHPGDSGNVKSDNVASGANYFSLIQRNKFSVGDTVEIMKPDGRDIKAEVLSIQDEDGNEMESAPHARQKLRVLLSETPQKYDIIRKKACRA